MYETELITIADKGGLSNDPGENGRLGCDIRATMIATYKAGPCWLAYVIRINHGYLVVE